jgi:hypothetical protein
MNRRKGPAVSHTALLLGALLVGSAWPTAAQAQGADKAAAEALFTQARQLMSEQRYAEACSKFEASQQLDAGLGTLLHLADCYEKAQRLASAWATFREAAALAATRGEPERSQIAKVRAAALEPQLLRLQIEAPPNAPESLEVRRNGVLVPLAALGTAVPVDAGTWLIRVSAEGYQPYEASVSLQQTDPKVPYVLEVPALMPAAKATEAAPRPQAEQPGAAAGTSAQQDTSTPGSQRTLGLIVGSAGLIAGVVSGIFTVMGMSSHDDSLSDCLESDENRCGTRGKKDRDDALSQLQVATVAGIVAGVGIAAGTTLFITAPSPESPSAFVSVEGVW